MRRFPAMVCAAIVVIGAAGCHKNQTSMPVRDESAAKAFIVSLQALPPGQRNAYIMQHPDGVRMVMFSRDVQLIGQFNALGRQAAGN